MSNSVKMKKDYEYLIARALNSDDGRLALATLLIQPIRKALDYLGIARKVLQVDYIPDGVLPIYEKDINSVAYTVPKRGTLPQPQIAGEQVAVDTFVIGVHPEILRTTVRKRRFNVINRIQARSRATIQEEEDTYLFTLLEAAVASPTAGDGPWDGFTGYTNPTYTGTLSRDPLADAWGQLRGLDVVPTKILIHPTLAKSFLTWDNTDFDPITQHHVLKTGLFGKIWGQDIYITKKAPTTKIYVTSDPEFLGVIPIRQDIEVLDSPNNRELKLGWAIYEEIGFSILSNTGVCRITKTG